MKILQVDVKMKEIRKRKRKKRRKKELNVLVMERSYPSFGEEMDIDILEVWEILESWEEEIRFLLGVFIMNYFKF